MNIAFVPVRCGSKAIPLKNIKLFAGKPLVYWVVKAAAECALIEQVYVATDGKQIKEVVESFGFAKVRVIGRSKQSASDTASTESAMLEFARQFDFENIALVQATSPLLNSADLSKGFEALKDCDSVLSVVRQKRFLWTQNGNASPLNYDYHARPRRQDFAGFLVENGAFYITSRAALLQTECRLSGKIKTIEMPEETYIEIDNPLDWLIAEKIMQEKMARAKSYQTIKLFISDCDGTLTDCGMYYTDNGEIMKKFNTRDGVGLRLLKERGIITAIMTGENSIAVRKRGEKLGIDEVLLNVQDKLQATLELCQKYNIGLSEVAYIGDDLNDLEVLKAAGLSICPADAIAEVINVVDYISTFNGGCGAVRDAANYILKSQK